MSEPKLFWSVSPENGKVQPELLDLFEFLQQRGFRKRTVNDEIELYRQNGYLVAQTFSHEPITEITSFLTKEFKKETKITVQYPRKGDMTYVYQPKDILEKLVKYGWGKIFNDNNFTHLPELQVNIKKHTRDKAFFYFKNGFVEVTKDGSQFHPYSSISGQYIFKEYQIQRDITLLDVNDTAIQDFCKRGHDFKHFLERLAGMPMEDPAMASIDQVNKYRYLLESIGYLLHDYKQQGLTDFCVILCDDNVGGSGKGIIVQALRQLTKVAELDAKKDERFDPEELTERTRIKVFNDITPSFPFTSVYNEITDQAVIRHMHKNPRYLSYKEGWKVLFTSNHVIRGNSGADLRRQRVFAVDSYFNEKHTPRDEYGHSFFSDNWSENDWNYFYCLMFECVKFWLQADFKLDYFDPTYAERKLEEEFPLEFRDYIDNIVDQPGTKVFTPLDLFNNFKNNDKYRNSGFVKKLGQKLFSELVRKYLTQINVPLNKNHNRTELWIGQRKKN